MTIRRLSAEPVSDHSAKLGEGPLWDSETRRLIWIDIVGRAILTTDPATGHTDEVSTPSDVGAVALVESGGLLAALQDGVYLRSPSGGWNQIAEIEALDQSTRMNDGKCDPEGSFVGGTMARDLSPRMGALYRVRGDGVTEQLLDGVSVSNGLDWNHDGDTMYYIDSPTRRLTAYPYDHRSPNLGEPVSLVEFADDGAVPDGMTVDGDGCLWVAFWGGRSVRRYTPEGVLDAIVDLPVSNVTSCTFGDDDLATLYITTASAGLDEAALAVEPMAGVLFGVAVDVAGRLPTRFRPQTGLDAGATA